MVFTSTDALMPESKPVAIPCGCCIGCKMEYSRQWAVRCMHESSLHLYNSFITLTFEDKYLDPKTRFTPDQSAKLQDQGVNLSPESLVTADYQNFMKRFRKEISPHKIRFYHCGEYGEKNNRPHHHALIFGYTFTDKILISSRGNHKLYRSPLLEKLWPFGISVIGQVTFESASYVARYINKKQKTEHYGELKPPYVTMSRKPGIAKAWIEKWSKDVYNHDCVVTDGFEGKPPKFYDKHLEEINGSLHKKIKKQRLLKMKERGMDELESFDAFKNRSREILAQKRAGQLVRKIEN